MVKTNSKITSSAIISITYLLVFFVIYFLFPALHFSQTMVNVFIADVTATIVVFVFSIIFNNSSVYDPYWSVAPPIIVVYLIKLFPGGNEIRQFVLLALVLFWSIRLTVNWWRGWQGIKHQDWRYTSIAEKTGKMYWPVSFLGIHFMPTVFVFLGCLPLWYALSSAEPFNIYDVVAALFTFSSILTEWIADEQLIKFRKTNSGKSFMQSGLWAVSRHPNYLGEISFWGGVFLFAVSSTGLKHSSGYWTVIGFILMVVLFKFISIPLMEKRNIERKTGYQEYIKNVPALFLKLF
jgi:steroid 5-alpha reductase family enzyme